MDDRFECEGVGGHAGYLVGDCLVIADTGADCIKDMGKCMGALKAKYAGRMDFSKASALVKDRLC